MKKAIAKTCLCLLVAFSTFTVLANPDFETGLQLLNEGKYIKTFGVDARSKFKEAFENDPSVGEKIAQELLEYSKKLASNDNYVSVLSEDANSVLNDALFFDPNLKNEVVKYNLSYLQSLLADDVHIFSDNYCRYLKGYGATSEAFGVLVQFEEKFKNERNKIEDIYRCFREASATDEDRTYVTNLAINQAVYLLETKSVADSLEFSSKVCSVLKSEECIEKALETYRRNNSDYESSGNEQAKVVMQDELKYYFPDHFTDADEKSFSESIEKLVTNYDYEFVDLYENFKLVLSLRYFENLDFYFLTKDLDIDEKFEVFEDLRQPEETAYFYYDTSRLVSGSRGILLTDENLYYENLAGGTHKVSLEEIETITLNYGKGLSLTGWKLRINDDEELEVRLSRINDDSLIPFVSALLFFVNLNNNLNQVSLYIPEKEQEILKGSIWERHGGVIVGAAVVVAVVATYAATQDSATMQSARQAVVSTLSAVGATTARAAASIGTQAKNLKKSADLASKGFVKSRKTFTFVAKNGATISGKLADFYDKKNIVKMPYVGQNSSAKTTARGFLRDSKKFWGMYKAQGAEALDEANLKAIAGGRSPVVNKQWIKFNPSHKDYMGEVIEHHHLNSGGKAVPLPITLHRLGTNSEKWH